jgi:putative ABC transport system ATP-binding protein
MTVKSGEFVAVTGPTGTGKSTLINLISGLDFPTKGSIEVFGKDLSKLTESERAPIRAKKIGIVFQKPHLLSKLTVIENVELPLIFSGSPEDDREEIAAEMLELIGLSKKKHLFPSSLSSGEIRKVAIARALATDPALLLLDEPTSDLDTSTVDILLPLLRGYNYLHNRTIVLFTNSLKLAKLAGREIRLRSPELVVEAIQD